MGIVKKIKTKIDLYEKYLYFNFSDEGGLEKRLNKIINGLEDKKVFFNDDNLKYSEYKILFERVDREIIHLQEVFIWRKNLDFNDFKSNFENFLKENLISPSGRSLYSYQQRAKTVRVLENNLKGYLDCIDYLISFEDNQKSIVKIEKDKMDLVENEDVVLYKYEENLKSILNNPQDYDLLVQMLTKNDFLDKNGNFKYTRNKEGKIIRKSNEKRNQIILIYWLKINGFLIESVSVIKLHRVFENDFQFEGEYSFFSEIFSNFKHKTETDEHKGVLKSYEGLKDSWLEIKKY